MPPSRAQRNTTLGLLFLILLFLPTSFLQAQPKVLSGKVLDARTGEPLERVRVAIAGSSTSTTTNSEGKFQLGSLPNGSIQLRISAPNYALLKYDVPSGTLPEAGLEIALQPDADSVKSSVTVASSIFEGPDGAAVPSEHTLNKAELQSLGTSVLGDPLRSVQALPSVTTGNDSRGEISIRGSSFDRVGLMVDGILLDGFLHQITSDSLGTDRDRASFSIITPDRIAEVSLLNSASPASYGFKTAGLVRLTTRDGNREKRDFRISSGVTLGTAIVHDGPFASKRGSYLIGVRSSALNPLNGGDNGTTSRFDDGQFKVLYDLTPRHRIGFSALLGRFRFNDKKTVPVDGRNSVLQANSASLAVMANWDWTVSQRVVAATKLFHTQVGLNALNREGTLLGRLPRRQWGGRQDWTIEIGSKGRLQLGAYLRSVAAQGSGFEFLNPSQQTKVTTEQYRGSTTEGNYYAQITQEVRPQVTLTTGFRVETNTITREKFVSPRLALSWNPGEGPLTLRAGYGRHRQFADLNDLLSLTGNRLLKSEVTDHFTLGADLRVGQRSRLRLELFERQDDNQIFRLNEPRVFAGKIVDTLGRPANSVSGRARGFEIMWQRRSGNRFSGWASYSYLSTRMKESSTGLVFPTDFDQRHTGSLFGSYRLSETWSVNALYRLSSGNPFAAFLRRDAQGVYFLADTRNALRLPNYGRLDLRLTKTITWRATRWSFVLEGLNLLNQGNKTFNGIDRYDPNTGRILNPVTLYGFSRVGTAGIVLQF